MGLVMHSGGRGECGHQPMHYGKNEICKGVTVKETALLMVGMFATDR